MTYLTQQRAAIRRLCCCCVAAAAQLMPGCARFSSRANERLYKNVPKFSKMRLPSDRKLSAAERVVRHLQAMYGASEQQCRELLRSPKLPWLPEQEILNTITTLKHFEISLQQLLRIPWLITIQKYELRRRLKLLLSSPSMFLTPSDCAGFCCYNPQSIIKFSTFFHNESSEIEGFRNRVYYLAHRLNVPVPELTEVLVMPKNLFGMSIWRMSLVLKLMEEHNVPGERILQDPWMFLDGLKFSAVDSKKKLPQNRKKSKKASASNLEEKVLYLADKVDFHVNLLRAHWRDRKFRMALSRRGFIRTNLLLDEGYTLSEILMTITILKVSEERLRERLSVLRQANHKAVIRVLYSNPHTFQLYCRKIVFAPSLLDQLDQISDQTLSKEADISDLNPSSTPKKWVYNDSIVE